MPSQLRRMIREHGRDLHTEFTKLLPEQLPPIRIQRWTVRRIGLLVGVVGLVVGALAWGRRTAAPAASPDLTLTGVGKV